MTTKRKLHRPKNKGISLYKWWDKSSKKTESTSGIDDPRKDITMMYKKAFGGR